MEAEQKAAGSGREGRYECKSKKSRKEEQYRYKQRKKDRRKEEGRDSTWDLKKSGLISQ